MNEKSFIKEIKNILPLIITFVKILDVSISGRIFAFKMVEKILRKLGGFNI